MWRCPTWPRRWRVGRAGPTPGSSTASPRRAIRPCGGGGPGPGRRPLRARRTRRHLHRRGRGAPGAGGRRLHGRQGARLRPKARAADSAPSGRGPAAAKAIRRVAIVGAGIGGAAAARAVRAAGRRARGLRRGGPRGRGSGNPAALVTPRLDAGLAEPAQLFAQAFRRAVALYEELPDASSPAAPCSSRSSRPTPDASPGSLRLTCSSPAP